MEMENIEAIKALVRAGLGAAVLPACSVSPNQTAIRALRIRGFRMERELALALPKTTVLPQAIQKLASRLAKGISGKTVTEIRAGTANR
jgi:DNA-binding transcriptional LysR family regulator